MPQKDRVIWKLTLSHVEVQQVDIPNDWRPLHFGLDIDNEPAIWVEVNPLSEPRPHIVWLLFTGDSVPGTARYLGSAIVADGGKLVVHAYIK